jgi:hypothetical protein
MATTDISPIRFHGTPRTVEGLVPLTAKQALTAVLSLDLKLPPAFQQTAPLTLQTVPVGTSATRLRLALPESTPPGTYEGTVQIENISYPIVVEVKPHPYLVITPRQLILQVAPGTEEIVDLMLVNTGNVVCEITKAHLFGLFDVQGVERSIGAALGTSAEKGQGRLNRLMDEAADNHGGLVRVAVREGAGPIEPGALRSVRATLRFSDHLKPGRTYWGTWPILNLKYYVRVFVSSPSRADGESAKT